MTRLPIIRRPTKVIVDNPQLHMHLGTPEPTKTARVVHYAYEPYDVLIMRPTKWGNPFKLTSESQRKAVLKHYREWILKQPQLLAQIPELVGKTLGCCCKSPSKPKTCHGDVLVELVEQHLLTLKSEHGTSILK